MNETLSVGDRVAVKDSWGRIGIAIIVAVVAGGYILDREWREALINGSWVTP